jgi:hypothetical protein
MLGWDGGGQEVAVVEWNLGERGWGGGDIRVRLG